MKNKILTIIFLFSTLSSFSQYVVKGGSGTPLLAENDIRNKIEVYLLNGLSGAQISFTSSSEGTHQWYKYTEKANDAVAIPSEQVGNTSTITDISDGCGYFVGLPTESLPHYVWIIDYSRYVPQFFSLEIQEDEFKCEVLKLLADVEAEPLRYFTPVGAPVEIVRIYHLKYTDLDWDENQLVFIKKEKDEELKGVIAEISLDAPLQNTDFVLTGDKFAQHFGLQQTISTPEYRAVAVEAHQTTERVKEEADNEQKGTETDLGGSAPIDITFTAYANEPVAAAYIWKIVKMEDNGTLTTLVRYTDKVLSYTFDQSGRFLVQLEVIDAQSVCVDTSQVINVTVGISDLKIPNAFSPGSSPGVNDEFKVSYKSLISFKASIFNRWGNLLFQWNDPSKGWDGRVNGKYVATGVYFYVIEAKGADGQTYKKSGDINILRSKK